MKRPRARRRRLAVVPLYFDDCFIDKQMARQLRAAGHLIYVTTDLGLEGAGDDAHLARASELGAVLVSQNQKHFDSLHHRWQAEGTTHAGILVTYQARIGLKVRWLDRAARLLTPELARNQLMKLPMFESEEKGLLFVSSLA